MGAAFLGQASNDAGAALARIATPHEVHQAPVHGSAPCWRACDALIAQVTTLRERLRGVQFDLDAMAFSNEVLSQQVLHGSAVVLRNYGRGPL